MSDLQTMRAAIEDDLLNDSLSSQIDLSINRAIKYYQQYRFTFNTASTTLNTVASQESYGTSDGFPSDFLKSDVLIANINSSLITVRPITFNLLRDYNAQSSEGAPYDFSIYQNKIWLSPIPDKAYTLTFYYLRSYSTLVNNTDSNDFTDNAEDLIESRAEWWLYLRKLHDNQAAQAVKAMEMEALRDLQREYKNQVSTGKLQNSNIDIYSGYNFRF